MLTYDLQNSNKLYSGTKNRDVGSLAALVKQLEPCKRLMALEGIGEVCASMLYASMGDGREFKNGRQASVYIGLTPEAT